MASSSEDGYGKRKSEKDPKSWIPGSDHICSAIFNFYTHVQYPRTESGRQTVKVDPSTGSQVVTLLTEVKSVTGSQVERMAVAISAGGDGS